ncbi:MAG TPA: hypothetical protein VKS01_06035 [Bryobacteraceae bacterium]|nr:hypothetical protein [Bryobacteraceae bacterium]
MDDDQGSRSQLEAEVDDADGQIRSAQASIDQAHIDLCATADVIVQRLGNLINLAKNEIATIKDIDANWARDCDFGTS